MIKIVNKDNIVSEIDRVINKKIGVVINTRNKK